MADNILNTPSKNNSTLFVNPFEDSAKGIPSKIHDYCTDPHRQGKNCIWLCRKKGHSFVAWDVLIKDVEKSDAHSFHLLD